MSSALPKIEISFKNNNSLYLKKHTGSLVWETTVPFSIDINPVTAGEKIEANGVRVKKGFKTDLASVPRLLQGIFPNSGIYTEAPVVHDYMYSNADKYTKEFADQVFHQMLLDSGVGSIRAKLMHLGVSWFGGSRYKAHLTTTESK